VTNYWAIAPWQNDDAQIFDQVWQYDREHGTIAIQWHDLGDLSGLCRTEIGRRHRETYGHDSMQAEQMLGDFYNKVEVEDVVVARRGRHLCIGIGRVVRPAYFDLKQGQERLNGLSSPYMGVNFINVEWQRLGVISVSEMFAIKTISNIGAAKYHRLFSR
jgi:hypothetical protein